MTTQTEALKHLKAITEAFGPDAGIELDQKAWAKLHAAIKEALMSLQDGAQPEQRNASEHLEPVAWKPDRSGKYLTVVYRDVIPGDEVGAIVDHPKCVIMSWSNAVHDVEQLKNTTPPQRKPLTDEEIGAILEGVNAYGTRLYTFARAIEAAHGIIKE